MIILYMYSVHLLNKHNIEALHYTAAIRYLTAVPAGWANGALSSMKTHLLVTTIAIETMITKFDGNTHTIGVVKLSESVGHCPTALHEIGLTDKGILVFTYRIERYLAVVQVDLIVEGEVYRYDIEKFISISE